MLEAGIDGYINKPIRADELLAVVEGLLPATDPETVAEPLNKQAEAVFERSTALSYLDGDIGLRREMEGLFLDEYPQQMAKIQ